MPVASVVASSTSGSRGSGRGSGRGTGRGADSAGYTSSPCEHCGRRHGGDCWLVTGKCWTCGASEHAGASVTIRRRNCPKRARVPTPFIAGRGRGETSGVQRQQSETVDMPDTRGPARVYAMRAREDEEAPDVIVGEFSLCDHGVYALIDPVSSHSYISVPTPWVKGLAVAHVGQGMLVTNPREFPRDLMELPFREFDVILGMDWLSRHNALVDCTKKRVTLYTPAGEEITVVGKRRDFLKKEKSKVQDIPTICDYPDVFPDELPGLTPRREVEFTIDVFPGAAPVSIVPYRMAPAELKELKIQLQELLDKGFIRPSVSPPWGAP
ncbi:uncharacterized protein LOC119371375, partial [Jatropha curcas]|uniref:uncharacterized protein LOC119371375 n=1 Tax=Jatropha curcas TaxID=180498 RepID=UPI001894D42B